MPFDFPSTTTLILVSAFAGSLISLWLPGIIVRLADGTAASLPFTCLACRSPLSPVHRFPLVATLASRSRCQTCGSRMPIWFPLTHVLTIILFAGLAYAMFGLTCQTTDEVRPDPLWLYGRLPFHLCLTTLLILATGTDLRDYVIPDQITVVGTILGVTVATASGDLQMMHLWIDWNEQIPGVVITQPWIPEWIREHHHWHGLAWSMAGLIVGGGMIWAVRLVSRWILGQPALGFGDVTLMAMVGSFIGWQPVVFAILLAPACAILFGLLIRLVTGRSFVAFGPWLCAGSMVVLFTWKLLWVPTRDIFGHWPSLATLAGIAFGSLIVLLTIVRVYRSIGVRPV